MKFKFVPLQECDIPLLHEWMNRKHVSERWDGLQSLDEVGGRYGLLINSNVVFPHLVYLNETPFGYIQSYIANVPGDIWWTDQPEGTWGVDQFIVRKYGVKKVSWAHFLGATGAFIYGSFLLVYSLAY